MDRAEVVAALREAYEQGGMRLLSAIADDIRVNGPLHDPEWTECELCGEEFDAEPLDNDHRGRRNTHCGPCRRALEAADSRYRRRRTA